MKQATAKDYEAISARLDSPGGGLRAIRERNGWINPPEEPKRPVKPKPAKRTPRARGPAVASPYEGAQAELAAERGLGRDTPVSIPPPPETALPGLLATPPVAAPVRKPKSHVKTGRPRGSARGPRPEPYRYIWAFAMARGLLDDGWPAAVALDGRLP